MESKNYYIERFHYEHKLYYEIALKEIKNERKYNHWIWYIFPQLKILGSSDKAIYYGIENIQEAKEYCNDPYLGCKFREICRALLECKSSNPIEIMGYPDNMKLQSSMTLFYKATGEELFKKVLDKFYDGKEDERTLCFLETFG